VGNPCTPHPNISFYFCMQYHKIQSPKLGNQYLEDTPLRTYLKYLLYDSPEDLEQIERQLTSWGERCYGSGDLQLLGKDSARTPAKLEQYDAWGNRVDLIHTAYGYSKMKDITAVEGYSSLPYTRPFGDHSRLLQQVGIHLVSGAQGVNYTCNIGMTDGAAHILKTQLQRNDITEKDRKEMQLIYDHLISSDPNFFWDSGQWMTEKTGGSDVSGTETVAKLQEDGSYLLTGFKFFTSGSNSNIAMALARIDDDKKLSLFVLRLRGDDGKLNGIVVHKMKNKMGTHAMPTTELELINTRATLVSKRGKGVSAIAPLLNISRIGVSFLSLGMLRRAIAIARDYSHRRSVFGHLLRDQPLHLHYLAELEVLYRGCLILALKGSSLVGQLQGENRKEVEDLARIVTPLSKLYVCKNAVKAVSEAMECVGGTGYMEDSSIPLLLRDCQAVAIWEGTSNVMAMDVIRALSTSPSCLSSFLSHCHSLLSEIEDKESQEQLSLAIKNVKTSLSTIESYVTKNLPNLASTTVTKEKPPSWLANARELAFSFAQTYIAVLLLNVLKNKDSVEKVDYITAVRWALRKDLCLVSCLSSAQLSSLVEGDRLLALDVSDANVPRGCGDVCHFSNKPRAKL